MDVQSPSLVPKGLTIGLAIFAVLLGLAGFGFRLMFGDSLSSILPLAGEYHCDFLVGYPTGFCRGLKDIKSLLRACTDSKSQCINLGFVI